MSDEAGGGDHREVSGRALVAILLGGVALITLVALYLVFQSRSG